MSPQDQKNSDDHAAALEAMAAGLHERSEEENPPGADALEGDAETPETPETFDETPEPDAGADDAEPGAEADPPDVPADPEQAVIAANGGAPTTAAARRARAASFAGRSARAHHHQYKAFMIPVLITVSAMLFVAGTLVLGMLISDSIREAFNMSETSALIENGGLFTAIAYLLGAILVLGAWLFHMELKRHAPRSQPQQE
jgi:hypothetical protein